MSDEKTPLDQAADLVLYAPLGFVLEAKRLLPSFVERGRNQVQMAKVIGQFAVQHGQTQAASRLGKAQEQVETILAELGLGSSPEAEVAETVAPAKPAAVAPAPVRSSAAAADLPIADYDSLAASQVIPRLAGLSAAELEAVRAYEVGHRGRKTILGKAAQLRGE